MSSEYDVIILGSGPAGFSAAMQASKLGKKAIIVESNKHHIGGSWINTGTLPSKILREAAENIHRFTSQFGDREHKKSYERFKMRDVLKYKDNVIANENSELKNNLINNNVHTALGFGRLVDSHRVKVENSLGEDYELKGENILIATGSRFASPKNFTVDHKTIRDTTSILDLHHIPSRLVVIGSHIYALEFANTFAALGTRVSILNEKKEFLEFLDPEIKEYYLSCMKNFRISLHHEVEIQSLHFNPLRNCTDLQYKVSGNDEMHVIETEQVLHFGEQIPNTDNLGLESVGVELDENGFIVTNKQFETTVPSIYAAGDVVSHNELASIAFSQGQAASCIMFKVEWPPITENIPYSILTFPEIAGIGYTENEARENGYDFEVGKADFHRVTKAEITKNRDGLLKLIFDPSSLHLLGIHIIGNNASELIHIGQAVVAFNGTINYFINNVFNYPSYSEAYRIAAFNGINKVNRAGIKYKDILETGSS